MGRIKTVQIKSISEKLAETFPDKFSTDFENNKKFIDQVLKLSSKSTRNKVAGYITHIIKKSSKPKTYEVSYQQMDDKRRRRKRK